MVSLLPPTTLRAFIGPSGQFDVVLQLVDESERFLAVAAERSDLYAISMANLKEGIREIRSRLK